MDARAALSARGSQRVHHFPVGPVLRGPDGVGLGPANLPGAGPAIRVPVQFSIAEYEKVWQTDDSAVAEITGLFSGSPRFTVNRQPEAGHNISLGYSAPDYHRKVLAFVDECAAGLPEAPSTTEEAG